MNSQGNDLYARTLRMIEEVKHGKIRAGSNILMAQWRAAMEGIPVNKRQQKPVAEIKKLLANQKLVAEVRKASETQQTRLNNQRKKFSSPKELPMTTIRNVLKGEAFIAAVNDLSKIIRNKPHSMSPHYANGLKEALEENPHLIPLLRASIAQYHRKELVRKRKQEKKGITPRARRANTRTPKH